MRTLTRGMKTRTEYRIDQETMGYPIKRRSIKRNRRGGYVLVLVVLLLFGIMAMAALVIDIGFARLTQRQMQTAVDAASLEGLRGAPAMSYDQRQTNAEQMMGWLFDDDLDPSNGDDGIAGNGGQFGAGPLVDFSGSAGDPVLVASQLMVVDPSNPVYKPSIIRQNETLDAFEIELRRGANDLSDANLISNGPAVPYLFARGSLVNRSSIANGITVRATGVARQRRVVRVGLPVLDIPGAIPLAYFLTDWGVSPTNPRALLAAPTKIGQLVSPLGAGDPNQTGYCAVFTQIGGVDRVIGFGWVGSGGPTTDEGVVAVHNTTARLSEAWSELGILLTDDRNAILAAHGSYPRPLLAPVSGR